MHISEGAQRPEVKISALEKTKHGSGWRDRRWPARGMHQGGQSLHRWPSSQELNNKELIRQRFGGRGNSL